VVPAYARAFIMGFRRLLRHEWFDFSPKLSVTSGFGAAANDLNSLPRAPTANASPL
jgi:hypothetical protein